MSPDTCRPATAGRGSEAASGVPGPATDRSGVPDEERFARAALTRLAEPGDLALAAAVRERGPVDVVAAIRAGSLPGPAVESYRVRLTGCDPERDLARAAGVGARLVCPGDLEWPAELADLDEVEPAGGEGGAPLALWVRGVLDLAVAAHRSCAVVGSRAATEYGLHVATELGAGLAERAVTVVSGAAFGVDGAAHRGALAVGGRTVAVLACGVDVAYPKAHAPLLERIATEGLVVSEVPPGCAPTRLRFLVRNRLIAALTRGTVVVEAAWRSGALSTAGWADRCGRQLMVVPGPVTSAMSTGCHRLARTGAVVVTDAGEVVEQIGELGVDLAAEPLGRSDPRDELGPRARRVLEAVPVRRPAGVASIAVAAGVPVDQTHVALGELLLLGHVERRATGWRLAPPNRPT